MKITKKELKQIIREEAVKFKKKIQLEKELTEIQKQLDEVHAGGDMDSNKNDGVHAGQKKAEFDTKSNNGGFGALVEDCEDEDGFNIEEIFAEMERVLAQYGIIIINEMISDGLSKRQKSHLLIHHFAAEIDREIGNTHHETFKGVEIVEKVKSYSSLKIKMVFEVNNKREIDNNAEEIEWLYKTMEKLLVKVEKSDKYSYFKKKAEKVKKHIHKYGFDSATQLVIVLG